MTERTATPARTAVVVVNYGSHRLLEQNLGRVEPGELGARVVVVDNFSTAAERAAVEQLATHRGWQLVLADNDGFGVGVNVGVRAAADCETVIVLNPDVALEPAVIAELVEHCVRDPLAMITPRLVTPDGNLAFAGSRVFMDTGRIKRLVPPDDVDTKGEVVSGRDLGERPARAWLPATALAMNRERFESIGGFDDDYFLYWEDVDLSLRWVDAGGTLVIRHDLAVTHDEGGTQERRNSRALSNRYYRWNCRNRLLFAARHVRGAGALLRWLLHTPSESWQILLRGGRRQLLHSPRPLLSTVRGSLEGIGIVLRTVVSRRLSRWRSG